jgi:hypothetical protein
MASRCSLAVHVGSGAFYNFCRIPLIHLTEHGRYQNSRFVIGH